MIRADCNKFELGLIRFPIIKKRLELSVTKSFEGLMAQVQQLPIRQSASSPILTWMQSNKWICWGIFWLVWLHFSPETLPAGSIAFMVGYVFYRERTVNLVTICAAYLGISLYLLLGHMINDWPEQVRLYMGWGMIFSIIILATRFPVFGWILLTVIATAFNRGRGGYYYRRRRW